MLTSADETGRRGDVPRHVAVVIRGHVDPSTVRDFYLWCDELGVRRVTVCLPDIADRGPYTDAVADLDPPVRTVESGEETGGGDQQDDNRGDPSRYLSYVGGREEIVDGFRRLAADVESGDLSPDEVDADAVVERLAVPGEPDLLVEVSEPVLSDVLVWQTVYSELCYVDELTEDALRECIEDYRERERRYGR